MKRKPSWLNWKAYDAGMTAKKEGKTIFDAPNKNQCGIEYRASWLHGFYDQAEETTITPEKKEVTP